MEQVAPRTIRLALGLSLRQFAQLCYCSHTTVSRWERGLSVPYPVYRNRLRQLWRQYHRSPTHRSWPRRTIYVRLASLRRFSRKPGIDWHHWTWKKRLSFMAQRKRYGKIMAEVNAGRAWLEYVDVPRENQHDTFAMALRAIYGE